MRSVMIHDNTPVSTTPVAGRQEVPEEEAFMLGCEAYIYGYPLVLMDINRRVSTNVSAPMGRGSAPINQFGHTSAFPSPQSRRVVSPNVDTLYSIAFLDLAAEPLVLHVP